MKKTREIRLWRKIMLGILSLTLIGALGLATDLFSMVSFAKSPAKVTAKSAYIRKSADTSSEVLASVKKDDKVSIKAQTKGSDGAVWYQVFVDSEQLGFIRSDLVSITDGSTPPTTTETTAIVSGAAAASQTAANANPPAIQTVSTPPKAVVTEVNPTSATVLKPVRVRSDASTDSPIITTVEKGLALTVTGWAEASDGKWWRVNFTMNGTEVTGFIRSDYVEDITPTEVSAEEPQETPTEPEPSDEPEAQKEWEAQLEGDTWYLIDHYGQYSEDKTTPRQYKIDEMFKTVEDNQNAYNEIEKVSKGQKAVIIVLVIVIIAMAAAITMLIFKIRDMDDSAYFAEAERETARRRSVDRPASGSAPRTARSPQGGQGQRAAQGGQRPRPAQGGQGQRPMQGGQGQRPMQGGQGQRPMQGGQGQRPVGGQGQRPAGGQGQRPVQGGQGPRPAGGQGQRPVQGARPRPVQNPSEAKGQEQSAQTRSQGGGQKPGWKSKNFMNEDDEFEFEFLNWDGEDERP